VAWGDYDNDGRLDFLITGATNGNGSGVSQIWRNTGSNFVNVTASVAPGLPQVAEGSVAWGDYDNDGRLDFLINGVSTTNGATLGGLVTQLWRNTGAGFTLVPLSGLQGGAFGNSAAWGDYDNDGRLDFLIGGEFAEGDFYQLWHNQMLFTNSPPAAPTGLAMTASSNAVMLSWNSSLGLSYNVRAGATPGGSDLLASEVNVTNGFRRVPALGNACLRSSLPLTGVTNGETVYWSVQAVNNAFTGGPFATETSVVSIPQLALTSSGATNAVLSWTPPTYGWHLQASSGLSPAAWTNSPSGEMNPVVVPVTNQTLFYRLFRP
jgi:FG-GAP-like repeat